MSQVILVRDPRGIFLQGMVSVGRTRCQRSVLYRDIVMWRGGVKLNERNR